MTNLSQWARLAPALFTLPLVIACGHDAAPAKTPAPASPGAITMTTSAPAPKQALSLAIAPDIRKVCNIEDVAESPKFDFDSALLSDNDRAVLRELARCMTTGPLAGQSVRLTGRADPRGESEYNMTLGSTRASSAKMYLTQLGIAETRLSTTSRGALDASGNDEASWQKDRRVDVTLVAR